ncbi:putative bis(5'-nucleosyl)-tetraphosphatase [Aspergillus thermomutatus]|uniref:Uncharacterized protein n=1 Tax=Aspergillus thermomutatus TaxID=41047 RepID=A0A397HHU3_ASPTH|nr:uncharacterized protein CDV56_102964 [Aspergillus thermomutatus]RHZ61126.1 hypothetical protein CDV56_102964 [Aspergillus thermomutatus]
MGVEWIALMLLGFPAHASLCSTFSETTQPTIIYLSFSFSVRSGTDSITKRSTQSFDNMQLGLKESLPALVTKRFIAAKEGGHLIFSHTHLSIVNSGGISANPKVSKYQLRYCPALAKKPSAPKPDQDRSGPKPDPFENPSAELLIAQIPQENPTYTLVLNKYPVIPNHFILATKAWKSQTDLLEKEDLDAAYACVKAWRDDQTEKADSGSKRLFAFFNSGDESGASQPHRHLQFLPVEAMSQGDSGSWRPFIDTVSSQSVGPESEYRRLNQIPFAHFALPLPQNPSADTLHAIYLSLYRVALSTARGSLGDHARVTDGPAAISYNLAMTESTMMICPRRSETGRIPVDPSALRDVHEPGVVTLNGTILAGTLMVKAEAEWNEIRRNPETLADILATIGYPQPDSRGLALL